MPNEFLDVEYDGTRPGEPGREYVIILGPTWPGEYAWGLRAYGLSRDQGDHYEFWPKTPEKGQRVKLEIGHDTLGRLKRQRMIRGRKRGR